MRKDGHVEILGKDILGSRTGTCKGPGEAVLAVLKETNMPGKASGAWERAEKQAGARSGRAF